MATYTAIVTLAAAIEIKARGADAAQKRAEELAEKLHFKLEDEEFVREATIESIDDLDIE